MLTPDAFMNKAALAEGDFSLGSTVKLIHGGPLMTVCARFFVEQDDQVKVVKVRTTWAARDGNGYLTGWFASRDLRIIETMEQNKNNRG